MTSKFTHTGVVDTMDAGKKRIPLFQSGKYWKSERSKFDHNGNAFGPSADKLILQSVRLNKDE